MLETRGWIGLAILCLVLRCVGPAAASMAEADLVEAIYDLTGQKVMVAFPVTSPQGNAIVDLTYSMSQFHNSYSSMEVEFPEEAELLTIRLPAVESCKESMVTMVVPGGDSAITVGGCFLFLRIAISGNKVLDHVVFLAFDDSIGAESEGGNGADTMVWELSRKATDAIYAVKDLHIDYFVRAALQDETASYDYGCFWKTDLHEYSKEWGAGFLKSYAAADEFMSDAESSAGSRGDGTLIGTAWDVAYFLGCENLDGGWDVRALHFAAILASLGRERVAIVLFACPSYVTEHVYSHAAEGARIFNFYETWMALAVFRSRAEVFICASRGICLMEGMMTSNAKRSFSLSFTRQAPGPTNLFPTGVVVGNGDAEEHVRHRWPNAHTVRIPSVLGFPVEASDEMNSIEVDNSVSREGRTLKSIGMVVPQGSDPVNSVLLGLHVALEAGATHAFIMVEAEFEGAVVRATSSFREELIGNDFEIDMEIVDDLMAEFMSCSFGPSSYNYTRSCVLSRSSLRDVDVLWAVEDVWRTDKVVNMDNCRFRDPPRYHPASLYNLVISAAVRWGIPVSAAWTYDLIESLGAAAISKGVELVGRKLAQGPDSDYRWQPYWNRTPVPGEETMDVDFYEAPGNALLVKEGARALQKLSEATFHYSWPFQGWSTAEWEGVVHDMMSGASVEEGLLLANLKKFARWKSCEERAVPKLDNDLTNALIQQSPPLSSFPFLSEGEECHADSRPYAIVAANSIFDPLGSSQIGSQKCVKYSDSGACLKFAIQCRNTHEMAGFWGPAPPGIIEVATTSNWLGSSALSSGAMWNPVSQHDCFMAKFHTMPITPAATDCLAGKWIHVVGDSVDQAAFRVLCVALKGVGDVSFCQRDHYSHDYTLRVPQLCGRLDLKLYTVEQIRAAITNNEISLSGLREEPILTYTFYAGIEGSNNRAYKQSDDERLRLESLAEIDESFGRLVLEGRQPDVLVLSTFAWALLFTKRRGEVAKVSTGQERLGGGSRNIASWYYKHVRHMLSTYRSRFPKSLVFLKVPVCAHGRVNDMRVETCAEAASVVRQICREESKVNAGLVECWDAMNSMTAGKESMLTDFFDIHFHNVTATATADSLMNALCRVTVGHAVS